MNLSLSNKILQKNQFDTTKSTIKVKEFTGKLVYFEQFYLCGLF